MDINFTTRLVSKPADQVDVAKSRIKWLEAGVIPTEPSFSDVRRGEFASVLSKTLHGVPEASSTEVYLHANSIILLMGRFFTSFPLVPRS